MSQVASDFSKFFLIFIWSTNYIFLTGIFLCASVYLCVSECDVSVHVRKKKNYLVVFSYSHTHSTKHTHTITHTLTCIHTHPHTHFPHIHTHIHLFLYLVNLLYFFDRLFSLFLICTQVFLTGIFQSHFLIYFLSTRQPSWAPWWITLLKKIKTMHIIQNKTLLH